MSDDITENKVPIDKDFLMKVLSQLNDLSKKIDNLEKEKNLKTEKTAFPAIFQQPYVVEFKFNYTFETIPPTAEEMSLMEVKVKELKTILEDLMKKYKMPHIEMSFYPKL